MTFEDILNNNQIANLIMSADRCLEYIDFSKHDLAHVKYVSNVTGYILEQLDYDERTIELGKIAGYLHDIGNIVNRIDHDKFGGYMAFKLLTDLGMSIEDASIISNAIGCHDKLEFPSSNPVTCALIIADKSDVRRSRVRKTISNDFNIHDRVNYGALKSILTVENKLITLSIDLDSNYCDKLDYLEIFLDRMLMCKQLANKLNCKFEFDLMEVK